jgi:PAS domain S-box-containing protein
MSESGGTGNAQAAFVGIAEQFSRKMLERILRSLRSAVFLIDVRTDTIQECNPGAARMFGYTREEMLGRPASILHVDEQSCQALRAILRQFSWQRGRICDFAFLLKRRDGTVFHSENSVSSIRDGKGRIAAWLGVVRDVSEHKRAEEQLRQWPKRLIEAREAERFRVARELHDSVNQLIAAAKLRLGNLLEDPAKVSSPSAREILGRTEAMLLQALEENRRIAHNLRPSDLDEHGLVKACRNLCVETGLRAGQAVNFTAKGVRHRLPSTVEVNLFRILQEALANVRRHAEAKSVKVRVRLEDGRASLVIQDDGRGFDKREGGKNPGCAGLKNICERAATLNGTCRIESAPNQGTRVTVEVPVQKKRREETPYRKKRGS